MSTLLSPGDISVPITLPLSPDLVVVSRTRNTVGMNEGVCLLRTLTPPLAVVLEDEALDLQPPVLGPSRAEIERLPVSRGSRSCTTGPETTDS